MFHRETNPYFIHDAQNQPTLTAPPHVQPPLLPSTGNHPRFLLPTQEHSSQQHHPDVDQHPHLQAHDHDPPPTLLPDQHPPQNMQQPYGQHSFQIPLQQGRPKKSNTKKGKPSKHTTPPPPLRTNLPHIYVPHDIQHQEPHHPRPRHQDHGLRVPHPHKTKPATWFVAVFCAILWLIIFLGGLIVLLVYLIYRPHSPKYELSEVSLNAAYLDMGNLLNADVRLLANFTNINKKVKVDFKDMVINLYYGTTLIATRYIKPFTETKQKHVLLDIHLVSSQVQLPPQESQRLARQLDNNRVTLQVKGFFRTRYTLGSLLKYTYTLYSDCRVAVTGPPNGVIIEKYCRTKR